MKITAEAPGRICLFGEHQDYLGFPVIAAAIDRTIVVQGVVKSTPGALVELPDIDSREEFSLPPDQYVHSRDYLRSGARVLSRQGLPGPLGVSAVVRGTIPIQSGTSSSSAMVVAWMGFLLAAGRGGTGGPRMDPGRVAELAYAAEVTEFGESGGRMDHYASALGGVIYLESEPAVRWEALPARLEEFVLGDSRQPKDTLRTLARLSNGQKEGLRQAAQAAGVDNWRQLTPEHAADTLSAVDPALRDYAGAAIENHWLTRKAAEVMRSPRADDGRLADLMNRLQTLLRDRLRVSTPRLNAMVDASLNAGALAAKINGSGEGGCMFAWCPGKREAVMEAIRRTGATAMPIDIGPGLRVHVERGGKMREKP
ncbi:MAG: galactokinase family protein [Acidobacteriota bacterium]|jgi:galactokinase|nr:galactokinase family protein [Acidobacteriota bacterium]